MDMEYWDIGEEEIILIDDSRGKAKLSAIFLALLECGGTMVGSTLEKSGRRAVVMRVGLPYNQAPRFEQLSGVKLSAIESAGGA